MATIREYTVGTRTVGGETVGYACARDDDPSILHFSPIPTLEEVQAVVGTPINKIDLWGCFNPNSYALALPKAPPVETIVRCDAMYSATAILVAPPLPRMKCDAPLDSCHSMLIPATIPHEITDLNHFYDACESILYPVSIHEDVTAVDYMYDGCVNMTGEMIVRPTSISSYNRGYMFRDTVKPITLYGDQTLCGYLAATANNHNVSWSPWYDPVPAVTNRGPGSYTTAADMTRMVRNGALAVDTYAPGRMVYQQGDIVREDEWIALVEAAQTIDPTITFSTHYANLNKIEAAFDSAL